MCVAFRQAQGYNNGSDQLWILKVLTAIECNNAITLCMNFILS